MLNFPVPSGLRLETAASSYLGLQATATVGLHNYLRLRWGHTYEGVAIVDFWDCTNMTKSKLRNAGARGRERERERERDFALEKNFTASSTTQTLLSGMF